MHGTFFKENSWWNDVIVSLLKDLKEMYGVIVRYIFYDNAGKNEAFKQLCKQVLMGVNFKHTTPGTPQHSGCIERKFAILFHLVHAMLKSWEVISFSRNVWGWQYCHVTGRQFNHIVKRFKSILTIFLEGKEKYSDFVAKFSDMYIMTNNDNYHQDKFANKVIAGIWVGFADWHQSVSTKFWILRL